MAAALLPFSRQKVVLGCVLLLAAAALLLLHLQVAQTCSSSIPGVLYKYSGKEVFAAQRVVFCAEVGIVRLSDDKKCVEAIFLVINLCRRYFCLLHSQSSRVKSLSETVLKAGRL